ncbi:MAG: hypothetical protein L3J45_01225 [Flavobacteriaceae bacterium]|nr:hypothetical protein [Flavobacteriaceae bacterium]
MKLKIAFLSLLLFFCFYGKAQEQNPNSFSFKWNNGFNLESADKQFVLKFGGRLVIDHAFFSQDKVSDEVFGQLLTTSGTELRHARLFFSGTVYENIDFKLNFDFTSGRTALKDAYIGFRDIPIVGNIRVGYVKDPLRLNVLTSSKYISFMEFAMVKDFTPIRNSGILLFNDFLHKRLSAQAGIFRNVNVNGNDLSANDGYTYTGRISGLVIKNKKQLLHLGIAYSYKKPSTRTYRIASKPEAHLSAEKYLNTGLIEDVNSIKLLNFETAFVKGSFSLQAEHLTSKVNTGSINAIDKYLFSSYYGQVSYFLTGEHKKFKGSYFGFGRIKPKNNFSSVKKGTGAWEIALRYANSDLNSKDILGKEQTDVTLGLNWYLNPVTRIMFNQIWTNIKYFGNANIFQMRFQIDF